VLFVGIVELMGGPATGDADVVDVSTWPIAHGQLACAFPKNRIVIAPLYPFVSGVLSAAARIGHAVPFPSRAALGPDCVDAYSAFTDWAWKAGALSDTLLVGYVGWLALAAGAVALLRASGRGRCGWEPATLLLLACLPPVWMCLENFFHPQDLLAMGLALGAVACARRSWWLGAGVLIALATLSQQYALLVATPLLVVAPGDRRWRFAGAAAVTLALAVVTLFVVSSFTAVTAVLIGSANSALSSTVLTALHLHGGARVFVSRFVPLEIALVLAWWATDRLGPDVLEPVPLLSLLGVSLGLRLVFEVNMWGYYYMALAVVLVLLDVVGGRIRASLAAWLGAVSVVYLVGPTTSRAVWNAVGWGGDARQLLVPLVVVLAVAVIAFHAARGRLEWNDVVWVGLASGAALAWPSTHNPLGAHLAGLWWQVALVPLGIVLAAKPLLALMRVPAHTPLPERGVALISTSRRSGTGGGTRGR